MQMVLAALLAVAAGANDPAVSEINRMLVNAGLVAAAGQADAPVSIASATQEYGNPTPDACCHTFTPLKIGQRTFSKGIGAHSNGRIAVRLNQPAQSFHAWVGIDNNSDTMTRGSVVFKVTVDGQTRYTSPLCRGGDEPLEVTVDLAGARDLVLEITDAGDGVSYDQADWADAAIRIGTEAVYLGDLLQSDLFRAVPTSFDYDGKNCWEAFTSWEAHSPETRQAGVHTEHARAWKDPATGFTATLCATVYAQPAACELRWDFQSAPDKPSSLISSVRSIDFSAPARDGQAALLSSSGGLTGGLSGKNERTGFALQTTPLGAKTLGSTGGRSSNGDLPFMILPRLAGGAGLAAGLAWSGQWKCDAAFDKQRNETRVAAGMDPCAFRLPAGDRVVMPAALFVPFNGDQPTGSNALRRVIHTHYAARLGGQLPLPPVSFNSWFIFNNNVNEQMLRELADAANGIGLDYFCLDAGWFDGDFSEGVGNWTVNRVKFPNGLRAVSDHVHRLGMKFGLWFEPERVANGTRWQREHPEWLLGNNLLNLGEPGARSLVLDMMSSIISEAGVDWIRYDFNIDPLAHWGTAETEGQQGLCQLRYINGLYQTLDDLMARHPNLFIEQCSSGGRRIDLQTIRRGHTYWKSDETFDQPLMRFHETGGNTFLPGGFLNTNYCKFRSQGELLALFAGPLGFGLDFRTLQPDQKAAIAQAVAAYKEVRRFINEDYYPLFDQTASDRDWSGWQFIDPVLQQGFFVVYRPSTSPYASADIQLSGLQPGAQYNLKNLISGEQKQASASSPSTTLPLQLQPDNAQAWSFTAK